MEFDKIYVVEQTDEGSRIDRYLTECEDTFSRSYIQKLINEGNAKVNCKVVKGSYRVSEGDEIVFTVMPPKELAVVPENIPLSILYEDKDVIVVNKPKGMVVHPAAGHTSGTLVNALLYHCREDLSGINGVLRPGIVHRIDMDTSGVLVVCKNDISHRSIAEQLKQHSSKRVYEAICYGTFSENSGRVEAPIGRHPVERKKMAINYSNGKPAVTNYRVIETLSNHYSHIECRLETGRTHQIRVHMASIQHPLLGDPLYSAIKSNIKTQGQMLHARILGFMHPMTHEYMEFEAPLPDEFEEVIRRLKGKNV